MSYMGWKAAIICGVVGFLIGFIFRILVNMMFFPNISTLEAGLMLTLSPKTKIDVILNFFVPLPYALFGALFGLVYSRKK